MLTQHECHCGNKQTDPLTPDGFCEACDEAYRTRDRKKPKKSNKNANQDRVRCTQCGHACPNDRPCGECGEESMGPDDRLCVTCLKAKSKGSSNDDGLELATLMTLAPEAVESAVKFAGPVNSTRAEFLALTALRDTINHRILLLVCEKGISEDL